MKPVNTSTPYINVKLFVIASCSHLKAVPLFTPDEHLLKLLKTTSLKRLQYVAVEGTDRSQWMLQPSGFHDSDTFLLLDILRCCRAGWRTSGQSVCPAVLRCGPEGRCAGTLEILEPHQSNVVGMK